MPATVIMERVGWTRGRTVFYDRVARAAAVVRAAGSGVADGVSAGRAGAVRSVVPAGGCAVGVRAGRSAAGAGDGVRVFAVDHGADDPVPAAADLLAGHWALSAGWGRVPRALVWDNESAVGQWRAGRPQLTEAMNAFRGMLGIRVDPVPAAGPGGEGPGGAGQRLSGDLVPARAGRSPHRRISTPSSATGWPGRTSGSTAGWAAARSTGGTPDRAAMLALPPVPPVVGLAVDDPAAARSLRAVGRQRLLGAPVRGRPAGRGRRRPGAGAGDLRRPAGRRARAVLGEASDASPTRSTRRPPPRCGHAARHRPSRSRSTPR